MRRRRRLGPRGGGGHRGHFPSLEDTGGLSPGWGVGRESNNHYGCASPGTHCHTAGPAPEHRPASTPACVHQLGDVHHGGGQGLTGSNSLGIPGKGLQAWADLSHWLRVHICTPSQDEISETTGLLIRRPDWQSSRHSPCPRERAGQVSAPISNSDLGSQEAECHPSRHQRSHHTLLPEAGGCQVQWFRNWAARQDILLWSPAPAGRRVPATCGALSLQPMPFFPGDHVWPGSAVCSLPHHPTPPHTRVLPTERGLCPSLTLVTRRALHRALWTRAQGGELLGRQSVGVQGS